MAGGIPVAKVVRAAALVAIIGAIVLGVRWCYQHSRGVEIRLHNVEKVALRSVRVAVTGRTYTLGDLAPGATTSVWAKPTSESAIEIWFTTPTGEEKRLTVPHSYFEPGNSGWMLVDLTLVQARNVAHHVELY